MKVFNFMGWRLAAVVFSAVLLVTSIGSLAVRQLEWGLDFTGGTLVEVHYGDSADLDAIRNTLDSGGYEGATVVSFGTDQDVLIRLPSGFTDADGAAVLAVLSDASDAAVELRRTEFIGPQVGEELREQGGLAMLLALGLVMLYIGFRFQLKFAVGAVAAAEGAGGSRRGDRADDPGALAAAEEQPGADRRAGRRQDGGGRGPRAADRRPRGARLDARPPRRRPRRRRARRRRQVPRRVRGAAQGGAPRR